MKMLLKPLQWIYCIYALLLFIILMLGVLPLVIIALFLGEINGGNLIYKACKTWGFCWYFFIGIKHENIYDTPHDNSRQYIFVANHISYMDIPPAFMSFRQPMRVLAKYEMSRIPLFGFIYKNAAVLVDRSSPSKRAQSVRILKEFLKEKISIFIFPEGTFNETGKPLKDFYDGAFRIAIETETTIKPVLFIDTVDRLHYRGLFTLTPGKCRSVFLQEVEVTGLSIEDLAFLKQKVYNIMEAGLMEYRKY